MQLPTRSLQPCRVGAGRRIGTMRRPRSRKMRGIGMIEVLFSLFIFVMMTLMFAAVVPAAVRNSRYTSSYAQAVQLAQHKIDQVRDAGFAKCDGASLNTLGVIDSATPIYTNGTTNRYSFTTRDNLLSYFPAGATGTLTISPWEPSYNGASYTIMHVQIDLAWRDAGGAASSYSTATVVIAK
jgi:type II secretory pathway pseudopilin PulG